MEQSCKNCEKPLPEKAKYCAYCGQKTNSPKVTLGSMLQKLWDTTFHIDNKLFRAFRAMLAPGSMAKNYFEGKRSRYPHPIRLFLIAAFLFLFFANQTLQKNQQGSIIQFDLGNTRDVSGNTFYDILHKHAIMDDLRQIREASYPQVPVQVFDSILNTYLNTSIAIDSAAYLFRDSTGKLDSMDVGFFHDTRRISAFDIVRYSADDFVDHYQISHWIDKIIVQQTIRSLQEPESFGHAYIGSLSWVLLTIIAVMSGFLTLLYRKQKRFYVEHFVFLLYQHAGMLFFFSLVMGIGLWHTPPKWVVATCFLMVALAQWKAMKRFYGQRWFLTTVKWSVFNLVYALASTLLFFSGMIFVFFLF